MSLNFQGYALPPGQQVERETVEAQVWWGRYDQQVWAGGVIAAASIDSGNSGDTSELRPGLVLGTITASGKLTQWDPYATDGSEWVTGIYAGHIQMDYFGTATDRFDGQLLVGGLLKADQIIIPSEAAAGIVGKSYEFLLREQLKGRFQLDDDLGLYTADKVVEKAAAYTILLKDHRTHFTNVGASGSVTLTMPAPVPGFRVRFSQLSGQILIIDGPATQEFIISADASVDDVDVAATVFETFDMIGVRASAGPAVYRYAVLGNPTVT